MTEIMQIRIGQTKVGIFGLEDIFKRFQNMEEMAENDLKSGLLDEVKKDNYIPDSKIEEYGRALVREYKKFNGEEVEEEMSEGLEIKVLGSGCFSCNKLENDIKKLLTDNNIVADLDHVNDLKQIASYGIFGTPGLVINGVVKSSGRVPNKKEIMRWIEEEMGGK